MKKLFFWSSFIFFCGFINPGLSSPFLEIKKDLEKSKSLSNKKKYKKIKYENSLNFAYLDKKEIKNNKNNFKLPLKLNKFFKELSKNLVFESDPIDKSFAVDIISTTQSRIGSKFIAEGNVVIKSSNGIMRASKFSYDKELEKMIIEGDIEFKTETQFLKAKTIEYDFLSKKGYILKPFGSIDFKSLNNIIISEKSNSTSDNFEKDFQIKNVKLDSSSKIQFKKNNEKINAKFKSTRRARFKSDRIDINNDVWSASELKLTNDPFNDPQLIINNKDFKLFKEKNNTLIKTKWSSLTFEDKLTIPIGSRNINLDKENYFKWGLAYDKQKYDGVSVYRSFDPLVFGKNDRTQFDFLGKFNIQRFLRGKTKSFSSENEDVLGDKIEQDANILDFFGIDAGLTSSIGDWDFSLEAETNSADFDKLDKSLEGKSYLTKNIYLKNDDNYLASGDFTFFGTFREKTDNGSLGEILVNNSYGALYDLEILKNQKNVNVTRNLSLGYGKYESPSRINSKNLISKKRTNLSLKQKNEYLLWQTKSKEFLTEDYIYSPSVINQGLFWLIEGNADFFRYEDGNKQDVILIKTGPKLVLGSFKKDYLDYTEIQLYPRFKFNRGESPFSFDQVVDSSVVEFNIKQHLYKALAIKFSGDFNLETNNSEDNFINPTIEISWNRRAYNIGLFYNLDNEEGGINFDIYSFNFSGLGKEF